MRFQFVLLALVSELALGYTTIPCSTVSGSTYRATVPRSTVSSTSTVTPTSTIYRTLLVTPPVTTRTVVSTITETVPTSLTDKTTTFTRTTLTFTRNATLEVTSGTATRTVTSTSYASAVVIPTGPAFRPIKDTMASPTPGTGKRDAIVEEQEAVLPDSARFRRALYPQRVVCTKRATVTASTRTVTSPFPTITLTASTSLKTSTAYATKYTTVYAGGVSTSIVSLYNYDPVTTRTTETVAVTSTVTASAVVATPTSYDACGANNMITTAGSNTIQTWYNRPGPERNYVMLPFGKVTTGADCCGACQASPTCAASAWNGFCYLLQLEDGQTCGAAQTVTLEAGYYLTNNTAGQSARYVMSNGPCAALYNGGALP